MNVNYTALKERYQESITHNLGMKNSIDRRINVFMARSPVNVQNDRSLTRISQENPCRHSNRSTPFPSLLEQSNSALHKDSNAQ